MERRKNALYGASRPTRHGEQQWGTNAKRTRIDDDIILRNIITTVRYERQKKKKKNQNVIANGSNTETMNVRAGER